MYTAIHKAAREAKKHTNFSPRSMGEEVYLLGSAMVMFQIIPEVQLEDKYSPMWEQVAMLVLSKSSAFSYHTAYPQWVWRFVQAFAQLQGKQRTVTDEERARMSSQVQAEQPRILQWMRGNVPSGAGQMRMGSGAASPSNPARTSLPPYPNRSTNSGTDYRHLEHASSKGYGFKVKLMSMSSNPLTSTLINRFGFDALEVKVLYASGVPGMQTETLALPVYQVAEHGEDVTRRHVIDVTVDASSVPTSILNRLMSAATTGWTKWEQVIGKPGSTKMQCKFFAQVASHARDMDRTVLVFRISVTDRRMIQGDTLEEAVAAPGYSQSQAEAAYKAAYESQMPSAEAMDEVKRALGEPAEPAAQQAVAVGEIERPKKGPKHTTRRRGRQ